VTTGENGPIPDQKHTISSIPAPLKIILPISFSIIRWQLQLSFGFTQELRPSLKKKSSVTIFTFRSYYHPCEIFESKFLSNRTAYIGEIKGSLKMFLSKGQLSNFSYTYVWTEKIDLTCFYTHHVHHVQYLSSGGGAEVLPNPSGDGFEADNSINFLGQSILFDNLLSFTLWNISDGTLKSFWQLINDLSSENKS
jgi:hypothetical protein